MDRALVKTAVIGIFGAMALILIQVFSPDIMFGGMASASALFVIFIGTQQSRNGTDPLTGIFDQTSLRYAIDNAIKKKLSFYLIIVELKDFKTINKQFGQLGGDLFLKAIAHCLWELNPSNTYRMVGAGFVLLLIDKPISVCQNKFNNVMRLFNQPWQTGGMQSMVKASFADISCKADSYANANEIISWIEYAIISLKANQNSSCLHFSRSIREEYERRLHIISQIRKSLAVKSFRMCYQPIYSIHKGAFIGAEALLRMNDCDGTPVPPSEFIPLAEDFGLVEEIGYLALRMVLEFITQNHLPDEWYISVNISMQQFTKPDFALRYIELLREYGVSPSRIKLEMTEYVLLSNEEAANNNIRLLREAGTGILLDDFGAGYSNLFVLSHLPIECVKFDKSLIDNTKTGDKAYAMVHTFISGIRHTGMLTLLEGVEEEKQKDMALKMGADLLQGYYFSRPLEADVFAKKFCDVSPYSGENEA